MTVWDLLVGQPQAVQVLRGAAEEGRQILEGKPGSGQLSHAWLITGPPGSGRSTAARCLAAALQCTGETVGCGVCPGCRTVLAGTNADVQQHATDLAIIKIDEVRRWVDSSYRLPALARWRVTVVEDADRMPERTSNVLLKAVEEPPARGIWLLCAPGVDDVLPTIRSRCRLLSLRTPAAEDVAAYLVKTDQVTNEQALQAARLAQSHIGVARALLKNSDMRKQRLERLELLLSPETTAQAVVAAGQLHALAKLRAAERTEQINSGERQDLFRALGIEPGKRVPPALQPQVRRLEEEQERRAKRAVTDVLDGTLVDLLGLLRDVLVVQLGSTAPLVQVDIEDRIRRIAATASSGQTLDQVEAVELARGRLQTNASPLLVLEALTISLVQSAVSHTP